MSAPADTLRTYRCERLARNPKWIAVVDARTLAAPHAHLAIAAFRRPEDQLRDTLRLWPGDAASATLPDVTILWAEPADGSRRWIHARASRRAVVRDARRQAEATA